MTPRPASARGSSSEIAPPELPLLPPPEPPLELPPVADGVNTEVADARHEDEAAERPLVPEGA